MLEYHLHMLWKYKRFNTSSLQLTDGSPLEIYDVGQGPNDKSGPDFELAKMKYHEAQWTGNVEIHVKASDWYKHGHHEQASYNNVILHVVWEMDAEVQRENGTIVPCLELNRLVPYNWHERLNAFLSQQQVIPCASQLSKVPSLLLHQQQEKVFVERLVRKENEIAQVYELLKHDLHATFFYYLLMKIGNSLNNEALHQFARRIDYKILLKQNSLLQVEAILFGRAGLLHTVTQHDAYSKQLMEQYEFLKQKYRWDHDWPLPWNYKGGRVYSFPDRILAKLAVLIFEQGTNLMHIPSSLPSTFHLSNYWSTHSQLARESKKIFSVKFDVHLLQINVFYPFLWFMQKQHVHPFTSVNVIEAYEQLKGEQNAIIVKMKALGFRVDKALDTQACIELYKNYCLLKKCLSCSIGYSLLKQEGLV
jgi:hypothetical protein